MANDQSHLAAIAAKISTSSAMNPGLLFCLIICPLAIMGAISLFHLNHVVAGSVFVAIACYPILIVGWQLIRFTTIDPDRLQRDEHVQRMFKMQHTIGIKGQDGLKTIPIAGEMTSNPALEDRTSE